MTITMYLVFGALIGVLLGLLGRDGSILAVPALVYAVGLDMRQAIPVSLIVTGVASAVGAIPQHPGPSGSMAVGGDSPRLAYRRPSWAPRSVRACHNPLC